MVQLNNEERKFKRIFIKFIKEENAYIKYIKDFNKLHRKLYSKLSTPLNSNYDYSFNAFVKRIHKNNDYFIINSFKWSDSNNEYLWKRLGEKEITEDIIYEQLWH